MGKIGDEDWWDRMERHMEDNWEELEEDGNYRCGQGAATKPFFMSTIDKIKLKLVGE